MQVQARLFVTSEKRRAATPPRAAFKARPRADPKQEWAEWVRRTRRPAKRSATKTRRARIATRLRLHFTKSTMASRDAAGKSTHRKEETCHDMPLLAQLQLKIRSKSYATSAAIFRILRLSSLAARSLRGAALCWHRRAILCCGQGIYSVDGEEGEVADV